MKWAFHADHYLRYRPVVELIARERPTTILDVGCGSWGIGAFVDRPFTGCDITFSPPVCPHMQAMPGSILALPFADRSFDLVICSDVLEHVPEAARAMAIAELVRVTRRHLWLACPTGQVAEWTDRSIARRLQEHGHPFPPWLKEHLAAPFPRRVQIQENLAAAEGSLTTYSLENWWIHRCITMADLSPIGARLLRRMPVRFWRWLAAYDQLQPTYRTAFHLVRATAPHNSI